MHLDFGIALAGLLVGFIVGLTGMGGGALMTPILVLVFGIDPGAAVSSDLVAAVIMKPIGGGVHARKGTVHWGLVRWLVVGSVPAALLGSYIILHMGTGPDVEERIKTILGVVLLVASGAMVAKSVLTARRRVVGELPAPVIARPLLTALIGVVGGVIVGMTSVGSGSLMIVMLMMLYPRLAMREMVGTDLVQAIPLVMSAALGHILWGHLDLALTGSVLIGSVPGVFFGSHLSSRANDALIRPVLVAVLVLSATKLLGASNELLLRLIIAAVVVGAVAATVVWRRKAAARVANPEVREAVAVGADSQASPAT